MNPNHKVEITSSCSSRSQTLDHAQALARRKPCFRIAPGHVLAFVAITFMLVARRPVVAQVPTEPAHAALAAAARPDTAGVDSAEAARSTSGSGTATAPGASPVRGATATITGTVLDVNGDLVPGATLILNAGAAADHRESTADDSAGFKFDSLTPGVAYELTINVKGFSTWTSPAIVLEPSQFLILNDIHLKMETEATSITVYGGSTDEIAVEQVHLAEQQRVLGFIPNFYVVYDSANTVPLTPKLKFQLALRVARDPISILGVGFMSGIDQASHRPDYQQGAAGYGQRFGANAAGAFSDIMIGGAILPSLLHQDPRYFYQGTGTTGSRLRHAMSYPFICRGDNGQRQINFSSIGGDVGATALSMAYYPSSNRGMGDALVTLGINQAERILGGIAQEFILPRFTPSLRRTR